MHGLHKFVMDEKAILASRGGPFSSTDTLKICAECNFRNRVADNLCRECYEAVSARAIRGGYDRVVPMVIKPRPPMYGVARYLLAVALLIASPLGVRPFACAQSDLQRAASDVAGEQE